MNTDIKQAMHVEAGKSFGTAEANENERRWDDDKIDRKNQDPTNHYDKSRMGLNFEIGPDGKIHPLGYQQKSLEVRLMDRLAELGWHPFKADSKIQPAVRASRFRNNRSLRRVQGGCVQVRRRRTCKGAAPWAGENAGRAPLPADSS